MIIYKMTKIGFESLIKTALIAVVSFVFEMAK